MVMELAVVMAVMISALVVDKQGAMKAMCVGTVGGCGVGEVIVVRCGVGGLLVRVAWCSVVEMDLSEVVAVCGLVGWWMLREACVWIESWLMLSSSNVVVMGVEIAGGRVVGRLDMEG